MPIPVTISSSPRFSLNFEELRTDLALNSLDFDGTSVAGPHFLTYSGTIDDRSYSLEIQAVDLGDGRFAVAGMTVESTGNGPVDQTSVVLNFERFEIEYVIGEEAALPEMIFGSFLEDMAVRMRGSQSDDLLSGTNNGDRLFLMSGDDVGLGFAGADVIDGGRGNDLIVGGAGPDTLRGGPGNDLLVDGAGNDRSSGGAGNDVFLFGDGSNVVSGGRGHDMFVVGADQPGRTLVRDFDGSEDVLLFTGMEALPSGDYAGQTLADVSPNDLAGLEWVNTPTGDLYLRNGDHVVILRGTEASDVPVESLFMTEETTTEILGIFSANPGEGVVAAGFAGDAFWSETGYWGDPISTLPWELYGPMGWVSEMTAVPEL